MGFYLVERTDDIGYDEVISSVIVAKNEDDAMDVASKQSWGDWLYNANCLSVKQLHDTGESRVVHKSFNAG